MRSTICAVAATKLRFHPTPSPNSSTAVANTLSKNISPNVETAITHSPPPSAGPRPIRSISAPTNSTSAYIPSTCAPITGKMSDCA